MNKKYYIEILRAKIYFSIQVGLLRLEILVLVEYWNTLTNRQKQL